MRNSDTDISNSSDGNRDADTNTTNALFAYAEKNEVNKKSSVQTFE